MTFFKEIIYNYLEILHPEEFNDERTLRKIEYDTEDSYMKNYDKKSKSNASSQKAYARAFRARHMLFLLSHYKLIPPAPSDNNTPPTNSRRPHSFSCPGSGHTRAENRYTPCCLPL